MIPISFLYDYQSINYIITKSLIQGICNINNKCVIHPCMFICLEILIYDFTMMKDIGFKKYNGQDA